MKDTHTQSFTTRNHGAPKMNKRLLLKFSKFISTPSKALLFLSPDTHISVSDATVQALCLFLLPWLQVNMNYLPILDIFHDMPNKLSIFNHKIYAKMTM